MSSVKSGTGTGNNVDVSPLTGLTVNADFSAYGWFRVNNYDNASFGELFFIGDTLGGSFWGISPIASTDDLVAYIYDGVAVEHVVATGETDWIFMAIRHDGGTADYKFSWRLEGESSLTHHTITANSGEGNFTPFSSVLGASDEGGDINGRRFVIVQSLLSDVDLLAESATLAAPPGTPLVYLDLDAVSGVGTNLGTGGNWTSHGTLSDDTATPNVALGGSADEPLERARTAVDLVAADRRIQRLCNVAALVAVAGPVNSPPPRQLRALREPPAEEPRIRRPLRFPESVDQPTFLLWSGFEDDSRITNDRVQRARSFALPEPVAAAADSPPYAREGLASEALTEEPRIRLRRTFLDSPAAVVNQPPPPRRGVAAEPLPEEPRIRQLRRAPESVDLPVLGVWEIVDSDPPEEARIRRAPRLPDPPVAAPDQPPAPRWRTTADTPSQDVRSARSRWVLESGELPAAGQPLSRWRTLLETTTEEGRIRVLRRLPESVDEPALKRRWSPAEELAEEHLAARPRFAFTLPVDEATPLLKRWRNPHWETVDELPIRQLRRLPESYVPAPADNPPQARWRTISDTPAEDLPIRRYRLLLESGAPVSLFVAAGPSRISVGPIRARTSYGAPRNRTSS